MRVWKPCPVCGKVPWRPFHANEAHGAGVEDLAELQAWAEEHEQSDTIRA